jgi:hypothetical protein
VLWVINRAEVEAVTGRQDRLLSWTYRA